MRAPAALVTLAVLALTATLAGCSSSAAHRGSIATTAAGVTTVGVSVTGCGAGWHATSAGTQRLALRNTDTRAGEVTVTDPTTGAVYAEVENLGPGTTVPLTVTLGSGRYALRCAMEDEAVVTGPVLTLTGTTTGAAHGVVPVDQADLVKPTQAYERYVTSHVPDLVARTTRISNDLRHGNLGAARRDWLPAHLAYERLGAAYGAFGDLDGEINGLPQGLPRGVHDPGWTGFHRLEYGLWHGQSAASLRPVATALVGSERKLRAVFADSQLDPAELVIRAHEISENALQLELTGESDLGSHSSLATVSAALDGTATTLALVTPLLRSRYAGLSGLEATLASARADVRAVEHEPLSALPRATRERVDADLSALCEQLAPVATMLEPRVTS